MSFPAHYVGSYVGTGASLPVLDAGFQPSFLRIYNDTDNDVCFDFFASQSAGLAVKSGAPVLTPTALSLTFTGSTPTFTGDAQTFSGTSGYASVQNLTINDQDTPDGNQVYVKFLGDGTPYLCCNMATTTVSKAVALDGSAEIFIQHDAGAASGFPLYFDDDRSPANTRLQIANTIHTRDVFIRTTDGEVLRIFNSATAAADGVPVYFDDGAQQRLEAETAGNANANHETETRGWMTKTPTGSISLVTGSVSQVTGTVTGNSGGSIGSSVSEISSQGITLDSRGFILGTDSSLNESGKTYRYIALR